MIVEDDVVHDDFFSSIYEFLGCIENLLMRLFEKWVVFLFPLSSLREKLGVFMITVEIMISVFVSEEFGDRCLADTSWSDQEDYVFHMKI